jgi:hypothetical protein
MVAALRLTFIAMLILLQLALPARADATADEIAYLLKYIRESPCTFIRNGSPYDGAAAAEHVEAKYEHFKREIKSTEDFIDRAATKSLLSGEPYEVQCGGAARTEAAGWLRGVLRSYRLQRKPAGAP